MDAFFRQLDVGLFQPTLCTRGPWSEHHQHAGPPAALVAGRLEELMPSGFFVVRVSVHITRPVPLVPLTLEVSLTRDGRTVKAANAELTDDQGQVVMTAESLALQEVDLGIESPREPMDEGTPSHATPTEFPFFDIEPSYKQATELRFSRGAFGTGDVMAWLRMRVPLIEGRDPSPLERVMVAADSGNGVSQRLDKKQYSFVNPDVTVSLFRHLIGEWVGLAARTDFEARGIGLADTQLYDAQGPIGRGVQTLVIRKETSA